MRDCGTCFYAEFDRAGFACHTCTNYGNWTPRDVYVKEDPINSPKHYTQGKIEPIDAIEDWGLNFRLANVVKYVARAEHKGKPLEDLKKAAYYLNREISKREGK